MHREQIFLAINIERKRQNSLHPEWHGDDHGLVVLAEEFGEVAKALYEMNDAKRKFNFDIQTSETVFNSKKELIDELIQVASVCVRWLENID